MSSVGRGINNQEGVNAVGETLLFTAAQDKLLREIGFNALPEFPQEALKSKTKLTQERVAQLGNIQSIRNQLNVVEQKSTAHRILSVLAVGLVVGLVAGAIFASLTFGLPYILAGAALICVIMNISSLCAAIKANKNDTNSTPPQPQPVLLYMPSVETVPSAPLTTPSQPQPGLLNLSSVGTFLSAPLIGSLIACVKTFRRNGRLQSRIYAEQAIIDNELNPKIQAAEQAIKEYPSKYNDSVRALDYTKVALALSRKVRAEQILYPNAEETRTHNELLDAQREILGIFARLPARVSS